MNRYSRVVGMTDGPSANLPDGYVDVKITDAPRFAAWFESFARAINEIKPDISKFESNPDGKAIKALFEQQLTPSKAAFQYLEQRGLLCEPTLTKQ